MQPKPASTYASVCTDGSHCKHSAAVNEPNRGESEPKSGESPTYRPGPVAFTAFWMAIIAACILALYGAAAVLIWLIDNQPLVLACICAVAFYAWFVSKAARS
jgi:hypothetical protein